MWKPTTSSTSHNQSSVLPIYSCLLPYINTTETTLSLSVNTAWHGKRCTPPHTATPWWSLVLNIKSRYFGGWDSLCKATDWYTGIVVGVETCEEWQTFSQEVINANWAIKVYGKCTLHWIYFWVKPFLALLGEDHRGPKNLLCCSRQKKC